VANPGAPAELTREARRALIFVALFRRKHGQGPTWRELRQAMGWEHAEGDARIRALYADGLRWRRGVERSLDVRPEALRRAIAAPVPEVRR
jgi:hypothetical protein